MSHPSFSDPQDGSLVDSSEVFRHGEFQLTQLGFGGDVRYPNVQGRLMAQFGLYAESNHRAANVAFFAGRGG